VAFGNSLPFSHVSCTFVVWVTAIPTGLALALTSSTLAGSTFVALGSLGRPAYHVIALAHLNEEPARLVLLPAARSLRSLSLTLRP